ncbi:unnamed protein product, partial [Phaeothamnion confervicola]
VRADRWGPKGHVLVHREALANLPDTMPDFFRAAGSDFDAMASLPDGWKHKSAPHLKAATSPDHYFDCERWQTNPLPPDRYSMTTAADKAGLSAPQVGLLPYRIAELYEQLRDDLALWRNATAGTQKALHFERNAVYSAALLGHFVGDASQPLHSTVHTDGWDPAYENPNQYRTKGHLHSDFETKLVTLVQQDQVHQRVGPLQTLQGDPLEWSMGMIRESNDKVIPLYELEKSGALNPKKPTPEGLSFVAERIAKGAQNLRDVWFSAWLESAALA